MVFFAQTFYQYTTDRYSYKSVNCTSLHNSGQSRDCFRSPSIVDEESKAMTSRKFYYPLSAEARGLLELLIMEACLLEVTVPQTRWLWQLHLASDPEIGSGGARRPSIVKIEEERLKRRMLRSLHQTKPLHISERIRAGRRRRNVDQQSLKLSDNDSVEDVIGEDDDEVERQDEETANIGSAIDEDSNKINKNYGFSSPCSLQINGTKRRRISSSRIRSNDCDQSRNPTVRGMHGVKRKVGVVIVFNVYTYLL